MNQIQSLLDRCAIVNLKYQKIEEASKASFNIFSLYVAFTAAKNGTRGKYAQEVKVKHPLLQEIIVALADWDKASGEDWWCAYKYTEPRVNFMDFQEAYGAKLANSVQRKKWVEEVASELIRLIERFKAESAKIPII